MGNPLTKQFPQEKQAVIDAAIKAALHLKYRLDPALLDQGVLELPDGLQIAVEAQNGGGCDLTFQVQGLSRKELKRNKQKYLLMANSMFEAIDKVLAPVPEPAARPGPEIGPVASIVHEPEAAEPVYYETDQRPGRVRRCLDRLTEKGRFLVEVVDEEEGLFELCDEGGPIRLELLVEEDGGTLVNAYPVGEEEEEVCEHFFATLDREIRRRQSTTTRRRPAPGTGARPIHEPAPRPVIRRKRSMVPVAIAIIFAAIILMGGFIAYNELVLEKEEEGGATVTLQAGIDGQIEAIIEEDFDAWETCQDRLRGLYNSLSESEREEFLETFRTTATRAVRDNALDDDMARDLRARIRDLERELRAGGA